MVALIVLAAVALACVALIGRAHGPGRGRAGAPTSAPSRVAAVDPATRPSTTTSTTTTTSRPGTPPAVGETDVTVVRGTRRFPVVVFYPAAAAGSGTEPLRQAAPYPLVVFSPGFDIDPTVYVPLLSSWVAAGYVVAEAYYPFTAAGAPGGVNESDIVQHPADLRAVIDRMLALSSSPGDPLAGLVDPARIGVAGHSDGGDVADAVVADSCCRDPRVRAAEVLSGAELASFGGTYGPPGLPLLVVQGDADQINLPACSEQIYDGAGSPRYYLDLLGAAHLPPYTAGGGAYLQAVERVTLLFWQAYLRGSGSALSALHGAGVAGAAATLTAGGPVEQVGYCPGAP